MPPVNVPMPGPNLDNANTRIANLEREVANLQRVLAAHAAGSSAAFVIVGERLGVLDNRTETLRAVANDQYTWAVLFGTEYLKAHPKLVAVHLPDALPNDFESPDRKEAQAEAEADINEFRDRRRMEVENAKLSEQLHFAESRARDADRLKQQAVGKAESLEEQLADLKKVTPPAKKKPAAKKK